jgi:anti-anti-sigma factor
VATRLSDRAVVVSVRGELDMATAPILSDNVRCHDGRYDRLIYDLDGLGFIDVVGFRALLECIHNEEQTSIRNPSRPVRRLLQLVSREELIESPPSAGFVRAD